MDATEKPEAAAVAFVAEEHWSARLVRAHQALRAAVSRARVDAFVDATILGMPPEVMERLAGMLTE